MTSAAVVVPVKAFTAAKLRLAGVLEPAERAALARRMAGVVVSAAAPLHVVVVCDDEAVRDWALDLGARVVWCPERGLNGAVADGVAHLAAEGVDRAIVAHADLPLATRLDWVADFPGVTLVPDRRRDGTNVAAVPTGAGFAFHYGGGSFAAHRAEAARPGRSPSAPTRTTSSSVAAPRWPSGRRPAASCTTWSAPTGPRAAATRPRTPPSWSPSARSSNATLPRPSAPPARWRSSAGPTASWT